MLRKKRVLIGGIIVFLAIGYLGFMSFQSSTTYYYTVSELIGQESSINDENVRVNGEVAPGSIEQEPGSFMLRFTISDDTESLPVIYEGVIPDTFKAGNEVVIEGYLNLDGIFQAHTLITKCPSKYVPEE
ncbi:cytochrome c maturation protein CcmE [Chloroflexota bacterium]